MHPRLDPARSLYMVVGDVRVDLGAASVVDSPLCLHAPALLVFAVLTLPSLSEVEHRLASVVPVYKAPGDIAYLFPRRLQLDAWLQRTVGDQA